MDETTTILVETRGNVGIITLNRPDILNAVNLVMLNEIAYQVETWEYDDNIRAIVIKGSDKAFAAGIDIKEMSQEVSQQSLALNAWYNEFSRIETAANRLSPRLPDTLWDSAVNSPWFLTLFWRRTTLVSDIRKSAWESCRGSAPAAD